MWESLTQQLTGRVGRNWLFAGLLPAVLAALASYLYWKGFASFAPFSAALVAEPRKTVGPAVPYLISIILLSLLLSTGRSTILDFYLRLPLPLMRDWLARRLVDRRRHERKERDVRLRHLTVLEWARDGFPDLHVNLDVDSSVVPTLEDLKLESESARNIAQKCRDKLLGFLTQRPTWPHTELVASALGKLWTLRKTQGLSLALMQTVTDEIEEWRRELRPSLNSISVALEAMSWSVERRLDGTVEQWLTLPRNDRWVEPTALGNRFAVLEDYGENRYGIPTTTLWIRLWGILPDESRTEVASARLAVETLVNCALVTLLWAAIVCVTRRLGCIPAWERTPGNPIVAMLVGAGCVLLSYALYRAAFRAAGIYSEAIIRLVDLNRLRLLVALGYEAPRWAGEERPLFQQVFAFLRDGNALPRDLRLVVPPTAKKDDDEVSKGKMK